MQLKGYGWSEITKKAHADGRQEGRVEGRVEGRLEGEARALLRMLEARGLAVTDAQRARILACDDLGVLDRWVAAVLTAGSVDELLG